MSAIEMFELPVQPIKEGTCLLQSCGLPKLPREDAGKVLVFQYSVDPQAGSKGAKVKKNPSKEKEEEGGGDDEEPEEQVSGEVSKPFPRGDLMDREGKMAIRLEYFPKEVDRIRVMYNIKSPILIICLLNRAYIGDIGTLSDAILMWLKYINLNFLVNHKI